MNTDNKHAMNLIETDIRSEDFREDSPWPEIIAECGPKFLVMLSKKYGGDRIYIPEQDNISKASRKRAYARQCSS